MKFINVISHPLIQILSFVIILISGESFGGPFGVYLYHAGKEGISFALIGLLGIALCFISLFFYRHWLQLGGAALMVLSLVCFFVQPQGSYNYGTFKEVVPLLTILLFLGITTLITYQIFEHQNL
jgi:CHASE2 domain-containing sensor protein